MIACKVHRALQFRWNQHVLTLRRSLLHKKNDLELFSYARHPYELPLSKTPIKGTRKLGIPWLAFSRMSKPRVMTFAAFKTLHLRNVLTTRHSFFSQPAMLCSLRLCPFECRICARLQ